MNIINKLRQIEDIDYTGGCTDEQIEKAEEKLNLKFPDEYIEYIKEFGATEWNGLD